MKNIVIALLLALVSTLAFAAPAANHHMLTPYGADLEQFPIVAPKSAPRTATQEQVLEAKLAVRPVKLAFALNAHNYYYGKSGGSWRNETIDAGTIVLVDQDGTIRYKGDCWNRLVVEPSWLEWASTHLGDLSGEEIAAILAGIALFLLLVTGFLGHHVGRSRGQPLIQ